MSRTELHFQTCLSDNFSIITPNEIFEIATNNGATAFAVCDFNSVQAFPEISKLQKRSYKDIKVVYGCEILYRSKYENGVFPMTLLVRNRNGLKELYKIVSNLYDDGACKAVDYKVIEENRTNLLCGAPGYKSELYYAAIKAERSLLNVGKLYDYLEIYPTIDAEEQEIYGKSFINTAKNENIPVIASCLPHYIEEDDKICCDVFESYYDKSDGHPHKWLNPKEMEASFSYLDKGTCKMVVFDAPNQLVNLVEDFDLMPNDNRGFRINGATDILKENCYTKATALYGSPLPNIVNERLEAEINLITENNFESIYVLAKDICDCVRTKNEIVGVRGVIGSSLVAFLLEISEINPLPVHYRCPKCKHTIFVDVTKTTPIDMPERICPVCSKKMEADGFEIPYETLMGLNGDKQPDIDLCFSKDGQAYAKEYLKNRFGEDKIISAGWVGNITPTVAKHLLKEFIEKENFEVSQSLQNEMIDKISNRKHDFGKHPGGWFIVPEGYCIEDFAPTTENRTHIDFHALHDDLYKIDLLGFSVLDLLKSLETKTGVPYKNIDLNSPEIYEAFENAEVEMIPEFCSDFVMEIIKKTKPKTFNELLKISGLSHGTNVWTDNQDQFIEIGRIALSDSIALREDIMNDLLHDNITREKAFWCMEVVRKGLLASGRLSTEKTEEFYNLTSKRGVSYADTCISIRYMFPKAHAISYVINSVRAMWYKIHYPKVYKQLFDEM